MIIQFDKYKFNGFKHNGENFVLCDDVRSFIGLVYNTTIIREVYNIFKINCNNSDIGLYIYDYNDDTYINWKLVICITMKYNYKKYTKYRNILEKNLDYNEIL
jgi:hypothetical protein